jgi:hypothetical protein
MAERADEEVRFWKRVSLALAISLFVAACGISGISAVLMIKVGQHQLELAAARTQLEKERDIAIKMWEATNDELNRERQRQVPKRKAETHEK